jgi:uncharacterized metal-binding protein YceD (DUF177 family)
MTIRNSTAKKIPLFLYIIQFKNNEKQVAAGFYNNILILMIKINLKNLPLPSFKPEVMGKRKAIEIAFVGLKPGIHEFTYNVDDSFFAGDEAREFANCTATVKLQLDKKNSFLLLKFEVGGVADVACDRCGNPLKKDLWDEFNVLVKMVDNPEEMNQQEEDPDVFYISRTESHLYLNDWIFEFVSLSVPVQKLCSAEELGGPKCNTEVLEKLREMEASEDANNANAIWKGLEKFKKN